MYNSRQSELQVEVSHLLHAAADLLTVGGRRPRAAEESERDATLQRLLGDVIDARLAMAACMVELDAFDRLSTREDPDEWALPPTPSSAASRWRTRFIEAHTPQVQLTVFKEFGLADRELLWALPGVSGRTLRRWRSASDTTSPPAERRERLDDVRAIIGLLLASGRYDEPAIVAWLTTRREYMNMERPLAVIGAGRFSDVVRAADELVSPGRPAPTAMDGSSDDRETDELGRRTHNGG